MNDLKKIKEMNCVSCNAPPPNDPAHIKSRGSGAGDSYNEVIPLCRACHVKQHSVGICRFAMNNGLVKQALFERGWDVISQGNRLKLVKL